MADISKGNVAFVVCTDYKCQYHNVVLDQNKPPKFCSQCRKELPPPTSADHSTKAVDESVQRLKKPHSEKVFGSNKPTTDLSIPIGQYDEKLSSTRPSSEEPLDDSLPIEECYQTHNDKHNKSFSERSDDGKPPRKKPREYESPVKDPHGNKPTDGKPFSDTKPNDQSSTDKSPSEKSANTSLSNVLCSDECFGDKNDDDMPQRDNKVP